MPANRGRRQLRGPRLSRHGGERQHHQQHQQHPQHQQAAPASWPASAPAAASAASPAVGTHQHPQQHGHPQHHQHTAHTAGDDSPQYPSARAPDNAQPEAARTTPLKWRRTSTAMAMSGVAARVLNPFTGRLATMPMTVVPAATRVLNPRRATCGNGDNEVGGSRHANHSQARRPVSPRVSCTIKTRRPSGPRRGKIPGGTRLGHGAV